MTSGERPLWREGTKKAIKRLQEAEAVQRAFLSECDLTLLLDEVRRRGWEVVPGPLPFEVDDD